MDDSKIKLNVLISLKDNVLKIRLTLSNHLRLSKKIYQNQLMLDFYYIKCFCLVKCRKFSMIKFIKHI